MHIRMFRATGWIHSAAVVPKASIGMLYGRYVERFSMSPNPSPGYKGAHLLWPTSNQPRYEVDFPEGPWDSPICAHVHSIAEMHTADFCTTVEWTGWHTAEIDWTPDSLAMYLDGRRIGFLTGGWVPREPMTWILQNETALTRVQAPAYSSSQLNIQNVAVYSYRGT
jgi:hypothetical protein